jgi:hypothetical protein
MSEILKNFLRGQIIRKAPHTVITYEVMYGENSWYDYSIQKTNKVKHMSDLQLIDEVFGNDVREENGSWYENPSNGVAIRVYDKVEIFEEEKTILDRVMKY